MGMDADTGVMYAETEINEHEGVVMTAPLVVEKIVLGRWTGELESLVFGLGSLSDGFR